MRSILSSDPSFDWRSLVSGFVGGAAGTVAMGYYWKIVSRLSDNDPREEVREEPEALDNVSMSGLEPDEEQSSNTALAEALYKSATLREPSDSTLQRLSEAIHWGYGTLAGGLYGAIRARNGHLADPVGGGVWGSGMWLLGSEVAVPLLGLSAGPTRYAARGHLHGLGAHLVYGLTTALVAQQTRQLLGRLE